MKTPEQEWEEWIKAQGFEREPSGQFVRYYLAALKDAFLAALAIGRRRGMEEAAEIASSHTGITSLCYPVAQNIAVAIRAAITEEVQHATGV